MKTMHKQRTESYYPHTPVLPNVPDGFRRLVDAAYASHGGAANMNLKDWRDLELELKRRLENEDQQPAISRPINERFLTASKTDK